MNTPRTPYNHGIKVLSTRIARWSCLLCAALTAALAVPLSAQAAVELPTRTILLFVAEWCAPCHAEVARLDEIAAAARPFRVLVVSLDDEARAARMLRGIDPGWRWRPTRAVRDRLFRDVAGLPYGVAVDENGRVCGDSRRGLDAGRTRALMRACRAP